MSDQKIERGAAEEAHALGLQVQRGYVFRVSAADEFAWECEECEDGPARRFGYHGNDLPPCGADYLYEDKSVGLLVLSRESDPADIDTVDGFALERVFLKEGQRYHDGTWCFCVVKTRANGEITIAGYC